MIFINNEEKNVKHLTVPYVDQMQEGFGSMKPSGINTLTTVLVVLMVIFSVMSVIFAKYYLLWIFVPVLLLLIVSFVIRKHQEKKYRPTEHTNHTEAIFKDYDI
ncbi:MAG: hypothetical protein IJJ15_05570 [Ruminococcus sp.]|nr:hypothetical protein [Ruminococcus sp.]